MGMIDIIKQASVGAVGAGNPMEIIYGEVLSIDDFKIKIDQRLILPKEFFVIPESLNGYEVEVAGQKVVIREGLKQGDKVLLLRVQGGQQYVILDRVM